MGFLHANRECNAGLNVIIHLSKSIFAAVISRILKLFLVVLVHACLALLPEYYTVQTVRTVLAIFLSHDHHAGSCWCRSLCCIVRGRSGSLSLAHYFFNCLSAQLFTAGYRYAHRPSNKCAMGRQAILEGALQGLWQVCYVLYHFGNGGIYVRFCAFRSFGKTLNGPLLPFF